MFIGLLPDERRGLQCGICLESDDTPFVIHRSPNGHRHPMHRTCLNQWLLDNSSCPMCRESIDRRVSVLTYNKKKDVWVLIALSILFVLCFSSFTNIYKINDDC